MRLKPLELIGVLGIAVLIGRQILGGITKKFQFGIIGAKVKGFSPQGVVIGLAIPITNNTDISMPLDSFQGHLMYGNYTISHLSLSAPTIIEAGRTVTLPIDANINYANTVVNVSDMVQSGTWWQSFRVVGALKSKGISFPLNQPIQIL